MSFEDRLALLAHRSGHITTHYSATEFSTLLNAANRNREQDTSTPVMVALSRAVVKKHDGSRRTHANALGGAKRNDPTT
ncbi:MAG: hypothetical protein R3F45_13735 [Gammaproteobacteria bacterium]